MTPNPLPRRSFLNLAATSVAALWAPHVLRASNEPGYMFDPNPNIIPAPKDRALWPAFREQLAAWRMEQRQRLHYSDELYRRPEFAWAASSYACYFLLLGDERFYDAAAGRYRVEEWLGRLQRDFGGCDGVVLWHAYPRIGLDERNQYDFYRDAPGGLPGLRGVVDALHRAGLRAYIDYNPWDTGTRRENRSDIGVLCEMVQALDVDGIFLDTMKEGAAELRQKLDAVRPGVVLEGEGALPVARISDHHQGWAQSFKDSPAPGIVRNKWFERRHLLHHIDRWSTDRTAQFHVAFMNGTGVLVWDNIFGSWNGYRPREKSILRAMLPIQRRFAALFAGEEWAPLVPVLVPDVYASRWEANGVRLWTLVNRADRATQGPLLEIILPPGEKLWDLVAGREVESPNTPIRARGIGCFIAAEPAALGTDFEVFLQRQRETEAHADGSMAFPLDVQAMLKPVPRTQPPAGRRPPAGMAFIPGGKFHLVTELRLRECGGYESTHPRMTKGSMIREGVLTVTRDVVLEPYAMDLTPVTNAQYAEFMRRSGYRPMHAEKFLHHWRAGKVPGELAEHPVVFVDLDDARAFARWAGKRLPTEPEWQFAAQGPDARLYPWGDAMSAGRCNGGGAGTTPVRQFPDGRSPFGIFDLCGNTWEWTESEHRDGVNRFAVVRGGSYFKADGSHWYMDGGPRPAGFAAKVLLTWPGIDRCSTVGFRCVVDLA